MSRQSSFGICELCSARVGKGAMVAHLRKCLVSPNEGEMPSPVLLVRAQESGTAMYWLDVAVSPGCKLGDLDGLLRRTWLECCGHLSEFYTSGRRKVSMSTGVGAALVAIGGSVEYVYDFGSSTELRVSLMDVVEANTARKVRVVARNEPPTWPCEVCGQPAKSLCGQCAYDGRGFYCPKHGSSDDCGEEMLLPVVNSPHMGVCAYTGEA